MSPIERAARALCELDNNPPGATMDGKPLWMDYLPEVRVVVEALSAGIEETADNADWAAQFLESSKAASDSARLIAAVEVLDALLAEGK